MARAPPILRAIVLRGWPAEGRLGKNGIRSDGRQASRGGGGSICSSSSSTVVRSLFRRCQFSLEPFPKKNNGLLGFVLKICRSPQRSEFTSSEIVGGVMQCLGDVRVMSASPTTNRDYPSRAITSWLYIFGIPANREKYWEFAYSCGQQLRHYRTYCTRSAGLIGHSDFGTNREFSGHIRVFIGKNRQADLSMQPSLNRYGRIAQARPSGSSPTSRCPVTRKVFKSRTAT